MNGVANSVEELDDLLSRPTDELVAAFRHLEGDIVFLGVGGKMGPTMARMAKRASDAAGVGRRIIGVSRFGSSSGSGLRDQLHSWGIETVVCDLLNGDQVAELPDAANAVSMTGMKFGTSSNPSLSWAMNCYVPSLVCRRYRTSRIAAFSSGNVYGLVSAASHGSRETDEVRPVGEYAMTVLGRERMYEYFGRTWGIPMSLLRLNYSTELRYGVLVDLALQVWHEQAVDVSMGYVNVIWQRDANAMSLMSLMNVATPPKVYNVAGPEVLRIRHVVERFGELFGKVPRIVGAEGTDALLNDARASYPILGTPSVQASQMFEWVADWISRGGYLLGKPTHFESRSGAF